MQRSHFKRESEILREPFEGIIDRFGGKEAGLRLLSGVSARNYGFRVAQRVSFSRDVYDQFEDIMHREVPDPLEFLDPSTRYYAQGSPLRALEMLGFEEYFDPLMRIEGLRECIDNVLARVAGEFPDLVANSQGGAPIHAPLFHVRSSATIEDFRDDRYFGTFKTMSGWLFHHDRERIFSEGRRIIGSVLLSFYTQKNFSTNMGLAQDQGLGLIVMPTIHDGYGAGDHLTVYSRYPEDPGSPTVIEISKFRADLGVLDLDPQQLVVLDYGDIRVHQAQDLNRGSSWRYPDKASYMINDQPCAIHRDTAMAIMHLSKVAETMLGYAVNLEMILTKEGIFPVQLRPVPELSPQRSVRELGPLPEGAVLLAETPFVMGSYRYTAPLVRAGYKNDYVHHKFDGPVIMWDAEHAKGHRFYFSDDNCVALLNPEVGAALTHNMPIFPGFGPERERFAFIGVPGLAKRLAKSMVAQNRGTRDPFYFTPCPITIESDGRRGRVYVRAEDAYYFAADCCQQIDA